MPEGDQDQRSVPMGSVSETLPPRGLLIATPVVSSSHDGRIVVDERNRRWCSDGFEIGCDNGEKVRVAFALDCCDREGLSFLATTSGIRGEDVRDLSNGMAEAFVRTIKRDYVRVSPCPNAETVMHQLSSWITHYNEVHHPKRSDIVHPVSSLQLAEIPDRCPIVRGL